MNIYYVGAKEFYIHFLIKSSQKPYEVSNSIIIYKSH